MLIFAASEHEFLTTPLSAGSKTLSPLLHLIVTFGWLLFFIRFANFEGGSFGFLNYLCYLCMEIRRSCKCFLHPALIFKKTFYGFKKGIPRPLLMISPPAANISSARCLCCPRPLPMSEMPLDSLSAVVSHPVGTPFSPCLIPVFFPRMILILRIIVLWFNGGESGPPGADGRYSPADSACHCRYGGAGSHRKAVPLRAGTVARV